MHVIPFFTRAHVTHVNLAAMFILPSYISFPPSSTLKPQIEGFPLVVCRIIDVRLSIVLVVLPAAFVM
jgi:hypothetical protein